MAHNDADQILSLNQILPLNRCTTFLKIHVPVTIKRSISLRQYALIRSEAIFIHLHNNLPLYLTVSSAQFSSVMFTYFHFYMVSFFSLDMHCSLPFSKKLFLWGRFCLLRFSKKHCCVAWRKLRCKLCNGQKSERNTNLNSLNVRYVLINKAVYAFFEHFFT